MRRGDDDHTPSIIFNCAPDWGTPWEVWLCILWLVDEPDQPSPVPDGSIPWLMRAALLCWDEGAVNESKIVMRHTML